MAAIIEIRKLKSLSLFHLFAFVNLNAEQMLDWMQTQLDKLSDR